MFNRTALMAISALALGGMSGTSTADARAARPLSDMEALSRSYSVLELRAAELGIDNLRRELVPRAVIRDRVGKTHVRLDQMYRGLPVFGEQLITHLDANGEFYFLSGSFEPIYDLSTRPSLNSNEALELAMADFAHDISEIPQIDLVVLPLDGRDPLLAYQVRLSDIESDDPATWMYFINARNGMIEFDYNALETAPATGIGESYYVGTVEIGTNSTAVGFEMVSPTRGDIETTDMGNGSGGNGATFLDDDNHWGNGQLDDRATVGVDAHFGAEMTWEYYKSTYGRDGLRGDGNGNLSRVHYSVNYVNAFWSDDCFCMTYGDGDGVISDPLVSLDVAGHEMTHGLTSSTARLVYAGQPGAINESMSDIFGTAVEFFAANAGADAEPDYWIGEDCWTPAIPNDALRYMDDPHKDGISIDHFSRYHIGMDVHYSSGLTNNVFYLAAEGGKNGTSGMTVTPIGRVKAEAIFYQALTSYMSPRTNFKTAKRATVQAAKDLFGQSEADGIARAWEACGVR